MLIIYSFRVLFLALSPYALLSKKWSFLQGALYKNSLIYLRSQPHLQAFFKNQWAIYCILRYKHYLIKCFVDLYFFYSTIFIPNSIFIHIYYFKDFIVSDFTLDYIVIFVDARPTSTLTNKINPFFKIICQNLNFKTPFKVSLKYAYKTTFSIV